MKKIIIAITVLLSLSVQGQVTYLHVGDRLPNLYYWDTNWWDYYHLYMPVISWGTPPIDKTEFTVALDDLFGNGGKIESARYFYTDSSLTIIGIAAAMRADTVKLERDWWGHLHNHNGIPASYNDIHYVDTSMANREDEYFRLYKPIGDSMELIAEVLWDTKVPPRFMICVSKMMYSVHPDPYDPSSWYYEWRERFAPLYEAFCTSNYCDRLFLYIVHYKQ